MNVCNNRAGLAVGAVPSRILIHFGRVAALALLILACATPAARADDTEDQYFKIYSVIQQGDTLSANGKTTLAVAKYREAQSALSLFQRDHRDWNPKLVTYRLNDLAAKLSAAEEKTAEKATPSEVKPAAGSSATKVRVLEAGAEPRKVMRLHPKAGDKQAVSMTVKMAVETKIGDMETPSMKMPPMKLDLGVTVKEVAANGDITYDMTISDASVQEQEGALPQMVEALRSALKSAKGLTCTCVASDRGITKSTSMNAPAGGDAQSRQVINQMKDSFANLTVPLPEEEVGAGAKWEVKMTTKSQGVSMDQTSVCELASLEGERLSIKSSVTQQAAKQKIENPAMPGMKLDLNKMTGKGGSTVVFDLGHLVIVEGNADAQSDMAMSMNMGGQSQAMTLKTDVKVEIGSK